MLDSFLRGATNAGTLGFNDEILGGALAPILKMIRPDLFGKESIGDVYKQARDTVRQQENQAIENHPYSNLIGNMGGGGILASPMNNIKQAIKLGSLYGAGYGLGSNTDNSVSGILQDVGTNALAGGILGGAGYDATGLINKGYNKFYNSLSHDPLKNNQIKDTRGGPYLYHGTIHEIKDLLEQSPDSYMKLYLQGPGFYTTDAFDVAKRYAHLDPDLKTGLETSPTVYKVTPNSEKIYDLAQPLTDKMIKDIAENLRSQKDIKSTKLFLEGLKNRPKSLSQLYYDINFDIPNREGSGDIFASEPLKVIINDTLKKKGYIGISDISDIPSRSKAHKVNVFFDPQKNITLEKLDPKDFFNPPTFKERIQKIQEFLPSKFRNSSFHKFINAAHVGSIPGLLSNMNKED